MRAALVNSLGQAMQAFRVARSAHRRPGRLGHVDEISDVGEKAAVILRTAGVELAPGLTDAEFDAVTEQHGFRFNPDHRSLLATALPAGDRWPDWRNGDEAHLRQMLDWPARGMVFDALRQDPPFWGASWGHRPATESDVEAVTRRELAKWPQLIPIYGHRMTPAAPSPSGSPVFSVWQTDVIFYGANLLEYLANEMAMDGNLRLSPRSVDVPYWTMFVEAANSADVI